jgi:hypothetical protein
MFAAPKTVNAEMMKRLVRHLIQINALYSEMCNSQYVGFGSEEVDQGYDLMWNAAFFSLDKRIWAQIEEDGGILEEDLVNYDILIAQIADTPFQEVQREEEE